MTKLPIEDGVMSWPVERLTAKDKADFAAVAGLLDAMSQYHSDSVPEVFDDRRLPKTVAYVEELLADKDVQLWVVRDAGTVVGVLHGAIKTVAEDAPGWRPRRYGSIEAMLVSESHRQKGIAWALLQKAQDYFRQQRLEIVELNVWAFNGAARKLYESAGYEIKNLNLWRRLKQP